MTSVEQNSVINLEKLKRKTSLLYFQDGLWDILLGFTWVAFGIGSFVYDFLPSPLNSLLGPMLYVLGFILFIVGKRYFALTRIGIVKHRKRRDKKMKSVAIMTAIFVVLTIIAVILTATGVLTFAGLGIGVGIIFGLIPIVIFGIMAYFLQYSRLLINGVLMGIGLFVNELLHGLEYRQYSGIPLIITGVIIMLIGSSFLVSFLKRYPKTRGENSVTRAEED